MLMRLGVIATIVLAASGEAMADEAAGQRWLERFMFKPPLVEPSGVCEGRIGALPEFDISPHATGIELVRLSLPFAPGALPQGMGLVVHCEGRDVEPDVRSLTVHPGQPVSVRRGMVTFPFDFSELRPYHLTFSLRTASPVTAAAPPASSTMAGDVTYTLGNVSVHARAEQGHGDYGKWSDLDGEPDCSGADGIVDAGRGTHRVRPTLSVGPFARAGRFVASDHRSASGFVGRCVGAGASATPGGR